MCKTFADITYVYDDFAQLKVPKIVPWKMFMLGWAHVTLIAIRSSKGESCNTLGNFDTLDAKKEKKTSKSIFQEISCFTVKYVNFLNF